MRRDLILPQRLSKDKYLLVKKVNNAPFRCKKCGEPCDNFAVANWTETGVLRAIWHCSACMIAHLVRYVPEQGAKCIEADRWSNCSLNYGLGYARVKSEGREPCDP